MTPRRLGAASLAMVLAVGLVGRAQTPPGQTVFRSATDVVTIDVAVRASGTPVGGLSGGDFVLLDNGVRQDIEAVALEAVPVDISILVDVSSDMADHLIDLAEQARKIAALARPTDRVRVMQFGTYVSDVIRAQTASTLPRLPDPAATGLPSAHDAIAMALLRRVEPDRRHLIVAITNGIDAISTLDAAGVREIARHSSGTLHIAQVDVALVPGSGIYIGGRERLQDHRGFALIVNQKRPTWRPYDDEQFSVLGEAADLTGGALHLPGVFVDRNASAIFEHVFADYRRSYLLRYTPKGVTRGGWHDVRVTIPQYSSYTIHARRGYSFEPGGPDTRGAAVVRPVDAPAAPAAPVPMSPLAKVTTAYDAADYAAVESSLQDAGASASVAAAPGGLVKLMQDFERGGNPWPANPRREAVFALELADAGLQSPSRDAGEAATRLLSSYAKLVRDPLGPDAFERAWLEAAVARLESANQPVFARKFADNAFARFPDEPRFSSAQPVLAERLGRLDMPRDTMGARPTYATLIRQLRQQTR